MSSDTPPSDAVEPHGTGDGDDRPNVVLVVMDTARATDTVPATTAITPTLASLAESGTEFTRAYTSAPWTLPSHASLFTGLYTAAHGAHGGHTYLDPDLRTLPEAFRSAGYETIGVSNNCWITGEFGFDRGFETFRKGWQYIQSDVDTGAVVRAEGVRERLTAVRNQLLSGNPATTLANIAYERYLCGDDGAARTTDWVDRWLSNRGSGGDQRPFFLFCNYIEPHIAYDPPWEFAERFLTPAEITEATALRQDPRAFDVGTYDLTGREFSLLRGLYRGELAYVDAQLGRLRESLEAAGEWDDTIVVVLGDHGENIGEYGFFGHQYNVHDTVVHVPLVVTGGAFSGGGQRDGFVQLLDVVPTLLTETGVSAPELAEQAQGRSFHPDSKGPPREVVYAEHVQPQPSISALEARFGELPERVRAFDRSLRSVRTDRASYVRGSDGSRWLYTEADETTNRLDRRPALAARLDTRLDDWLGAVERDRSTDAGGVDISASTERRLAELGYL
ncbi:MAG: sulfatase [Halohasta sp.]